jgi:hypothetical protein
MTTFQLIGKTNIYLSPSQSKGEGWKPVWVQRHQRRQPYRLTGYRLSSHPKIRFLDRVCPKARRKVSFYFTLLVRVSSYEEDMLLFLFWTLGRECAWTLGEGTPFWGWGAPGPQWGTMSISWVWTGEERRLSEMAENEEDGSTTASRNDHAQSKCHCASVSNSVTYPL